MECIIAVAIGLGVVVILIFIRQRLDPSASSEILKYQPARSFDEIVNRDPKLKYMIMNAKRDGASYITDDGRIAFYRNRSGNYERCTADTNPAGYWSYTSTWRRCKELPEHAFAIPETF